MDLQFAQLATGVPPGAGFAPRHPFRADEVTLRRLRGPTEIASVMHLREEIDLSVHTAAGAARFVSLEKKETSAASSSRSTWAVSASARSASCRSATS